MRDVTTLVRREIEGTPANLTVEQFVEMVMADIEVAKQTYFEKTSQEAEARYERDKKDYFERRNKAIEKIKEESYKKYTREYYRLRWVEKEIAKWPEEYKRGYWHKGEELTYVDWSMRPWEMGTSSISLNRRTDEEVREFFVDMFKNDFDNKYFSQCNGWEIVISQRPYFKLILSEELENEWRSDEKRLSDSVARFYSGSNYWGD